MPAKGGLILEAIAPKGVFGTAIQQVYDARMVEVNEEAKGPRLEIRHCKPKHTEGYFEVVEVRGAGKKAVKVAAYDDFDQALDAHPTASIHPRAGAAAMLLAVGRGPRRAYYPPLKAAK